MTPRERVMTALRGGVTDKIPFTIYTRKLPQCTVERELRNRGMCLVERVQSAKVITPNVKVDQYIYDDGGKQMMRKVYHTPYGDLFTIQEPAGFTTWIHERMFKSADDYKALNFLINDMVAVPNYDAVAKTVERLGDDFVVRDQTILEPLQWLVSGPYLGMENFCMEWMDNRDELLKLYESFVKLNRTIYPMIADGPLEFANYGGNVVPQIIGKNVFNEYYVPHYNEAAEILHKKGKLIGCHFDADNTSIMEDIAGTDLDYIEAYDPGMSPSVAEARRHWPDKVLWINWPSSWHLRTQQEIYDSTIQMIKEAAPGNGFLIGITEDVPEDRWPDNYKTIMNAIYDASEA